MTFCVVYKTIRRPFEVDSVLEKVAFMIWWLGFAIAQEVVALTLYFQRFLAVLLSFM